MFKNWPRDFSKMRCISFMQQVVQLRNQTPSQRGAGMLRNQPRIYNHPIIPPLIPPQVTPLPRIGNQSEVPPHPFATTGIVQPQPGPNQTVVPLMQVQLPPIRPYQSNVRHSTPQNRYQSRFHNTFPKGSNYSNQHFK